MAITSEVIMTITCDLAPDAFEGNWEALPEDLRERVLQLGTECAMTGEMGSHCTECFWGTVNDEITRPLDGLLYIEEEENGYLPGML